MKTLLSVYALTVIIAFGQDAEQRLQDEFRTRPGKVVTETTWPGEVSRIVAVAFDNDEEPLSDDGVVEGRLHKGVFMTSKDLTEVQTRKLYSAITGTHSHQKGAVCFDPHHGFIFYDAGGKILGSLTICFGCSRYRHAPAGELSKVFDLEGLRSLALDLKMPMRNYKELFNEYKESQKAASSNQ